MPDKQRGSGVRDHWHGGGRLSLRDSRFDPVGETFKLIATGPA